MAKSTIAPQTSSAQEKFLFSRKLKVRKGYYDYQLHRNGRSGTHRAPVPVPWVQIKGYWLNEAGFAIGTAIDVEVCHGRVILTAIPNTSSD